MLSAFFSRAQKNPLLWSCISLLAIVFVRIILEQALEAQKRIEPPSSIFLFTAYFIAVLLFFAAIAWIFSGRTISQTMGVVATFSPVLLIPPLFDLVASNGAGYSLFFQFGSVDFFTAFFSFCNMCTGVSPGLQLEVALSALLVSLYVFWASRSIMKALFSGLLVYALVVFAFVLPGYLMAFFGHAFTDIYLFRETASFFTVISSFILLAALYVSKSGFFQRLRLERSVHYCGLALFGAFLGYSFWTHLFPGVLLPLLALVLCVFFSFEAAVYVNDIADATFDRVSNSQRASLATHSNPLAMVALFLFFSLLNGLAIGFGVMVWVAFSFSLSLLYSLKPLQLSRHVVTAGLIVATCSAAVFLAGFGVGLLEPEKLPSVLPLKALLAVFGLVFLASSVKDLKDATGDKKQGRFTLVTWLGEKKAKTVVSLLVIGATLWAAFWLSFSLWVAAFIGIFGALCVLRVKNLRWMERCVFFLEFLFILAVVVSY